MEFIINDFINLSAPDDNLSTETDYHIDEAQIGKILVNDDQNSVIFIAIGVYDGGIVTTGYLKEYFTRFFIDPQEYEKGRSREDGKGWIQPIFKDRFKGSKDRGRFA